MESLNPREKKIFGILTVIAVVLFSAAVFYFIGKPMLKFVSEPEKFRDWVDSHGIWSRFAFIGMVVFQVVIAIVPGEPLEIGAGYAFGAVEGTVLCVAGITLGSVLVFALVRSFGIKLVELFFSREKIQSLKFLQNEKRLDFIIFLVFFIPGTPKDLLSYFAGLTKVKLSYWIFVCSVARLPSIITSTVGGSALGGQRYFFAIIVFGATAVASAVGLLIYRAISKSRSKSAETPENKISL